MSISIKDVEHVAKLARLEFTKAEKEKFTHQLNEILMYVQKLNELDTTNVEPLSHVITSTPATGGMMREDVTKPSLPQEEVLKNAPDKSEKFFKVPKVIDNR